MDPMLGSNPSMHSDQLKFNRAPDCFHLSKALWSRQLCVSRYGLLTMQDVQTGKETERCVWQDGIRKINLRDQESCLRTHMDIICGFMVVQCK